jgi:predicted nuclease of predicted toxin-antitoxin system
VYSIYDSARGMDDDDIIRMAFAETWILVTNDKDFGDKVYRERRPHRGIILMRLQDESAHIKIEVLLGLIERYPDQLVDRFIVLTEKRVRFARS